jgi:hypothetical protein
MPANKKIKRNVSYSGCATVVSNLKSHANDPCLVRMNEEARIAVSKLILPETAKK